MCPKSDEGVVRGPYTHRRQMWVSSTDQGLESSHSTFLGPFLILVGTKTFPCLEV